MLKCLCLYSNPQCPEVEPVVSTYLRLCSTCKEKMIDRQVVAAEEEAEALDTEASFLDLLHRLDLKFQKTEEGVKKHLPKVRRSAVF